MAHPDVPLLPSTLRAQVWPSPASTPSTATRCQHKYKLQAIAKELTDKQDVEDSLRAAVHTFVLLETPRMVTPAGTESTAGTSVSGYVSKGAEKIRKYLKGIDQPAAGHIEQQDAVLTHKAEQNMQRYREYTRLQQMRRVDNKDIFAAAVNQVVEEDAPEEDDRVSAYVSVFSSQIPEGVLQARQDIKVRSNTPSSGTNSSAGRRQQPRAARAALSTPGTPELPETQGSADRSKASTPLTGVASLNIPTPSDSRLPTPDTLLHHQALHRMDTFVPETYPPASRSKNKSNGTPSSTPESHKAASGLFGDNEPQGLEAGLGHDGQSGAIEKTSSDANVNTSSSLDYPGKPRRATVVGFTGLGELIEEDESGEQDHDSSAVSDRPQSVPEVAQSVAPQEAEGDAASKTYSEQPPDTISGNRIELGHESQPGSEPAQHEEPVFARTKQSSSGGCNTSAAAANRKRAAQRTSERLLASVGSFQATRGERRLARRESDLMWLNMAMQEAAPAALKVGVRKPQSVTWDVWNSWSEASQLAYVNGEDLSAVCEAMEAEREVMHCSEVARLQLEELGPVDAPPQAAKLHSYKEAISDLNRSRPIFRPCKSNAKVPLPAQRVGGGSERRKKVWTLSSSKYFSRRKREAESRDFGDMDAVLSQQFSADWARVAMKQRFVALIGRSDKDRLAGDSLELQAELNEVRECLEQHKVTIMMMMVYYSNLQLGRWGSQVMKQMDLDMFRSMVNDCKLIDPQAPTCRALNELDSVFVATNFEEGVATAAEDAANDDDALVQFELYEALVRLAFAKFINSKEMSDASDALDRLMEDHVLPNVPEEVLVDPNEFRFNRMYKEDVEAVMLKHDDFVHAIFQVYKAADRTKWMWMEHYKALLDVVMLLKPHDYSVTEQDARLLFFWSQSVVRDELRNRQRAVSLVYSDFVELICRLADHIGLPSRSDLEHFYGGRAHLPQHPWGEYYHKLAITGVGFDRQAQPWWSKGEQEFRAHLHPDEHDRILYKQVYVPIERRASCDNILSEKERPLHLKLEGFLDVLLYYMRDEWGGHDLASCTAEMMAVARKYSGDLHL